MIRKILLLLKVIQEKEKNKHILRRLNPYNPLTYITILLAFMIGVILFGVIGFWREIDLRDLNFKYR